jgi:anti-sigma B factor antagonist
MDMNEVTFQGVVDEKLRFELKGDIDAGNAESFYNGVCEEYDANPADLVFDCAELDFIDSTTLGTFVKILKKAKTDGKKMTLVGLQPKVKKLFVICSLDTIMEIK